MGKIVRITDSKVGVVGGGGIDIYYTILPISHIRKPRHTNGHDHPLLIST